jgi:hypothetical protein
LDELKYGISVTDKCIGWEETEQIILRLMKNLAQKEILRSKVAEWCCLEYLSAIY